MNIKLQINKYSYLMKILNTFKKNVCQPILSLQHRIKKLKFFIDNQRIKFTFQIYLKTIISLDITVGQYSIYSISYGFKKKIWKFKTNYENIQLKKKTRNKL